jgi:hypothetical protein
MLLRNVQKRNEKLAISLGIQTKSQGREAMARRFAGSASLIQHNNFLSSS